MPTFDLEAARQAGVPDEQIAQELARAYNYNLEGALASGLTYDDVIPELMKKANPTWTQRWGQAMDEAVGQLDSPEVAAEYETVKDWEPSPYYGPGQAVPQLDPVTGRALGENLRAIGQGVLSYPAALVDMAGEKLGFRKDEMENVPLMDQQYKSYNDRLVMLDAKRGSLERSNRRNAAQGYEGQDLAKIDAEIADLQKKIANIEANDPTIADRWIPSNPKFSEIRAKYTYEPESATGKAYAGVMGAAMTPAAEAEDWATDKLTQNIEDPLQREYAKDAWSGAIEGAAIVAGPKIASTGAKGVGAAARGTARVAGNVRDRVRDFRYKRSPEGKIETELSNIQAKIDEVPLIVREIRQEFPDDPVTQKTLIDDVKKQADEMRVERAKLNVQLRRERGKALSEEYNSWMSGFRKRQPQGSGSRSLTGTALTWMGKHPKSVIAGAILDGLAAKATGGLSLVYSGGNTLRVIGVEGVKSFRDWYRAKNRIEADSDVKAPKLGEQDLDALIKQLPDEQQAVINDFLDGKAKPAEVVDIMDEWVQSKKTGDDWLAEQADIEADAQRLIEEEAMFKQREAENAERALDEASDLDQRRIREEGVDPVEWTRLKQEEAKLLKEQEAAELAQESTIKAPVGDMIEINEAIKMAELRAARKTATDADRAMVDSLYKQRDSGVTQVPRGSTGTVGERKAPTRAEQKEYEQSFSPEERNAPTPPPSRNQVLSDLLKQSRGRRGGTMGMMGKTDLDDLTPPDELAGSYSAPQADLPSKPKATTFTDKEWFKTKTKYGLDGLKDSYPTADGYTINVKEFFEKLADLKDKDARIEVASQVIDELDFGSQAELGVDFAAFRQEKATLINATMDYIKALDKRGK